MNNSKILESLGFLHPQSLKIFAVKIGTLIEQKLWAKILSGMFLGLVFGYMISPLGPFQNIIGPYHSQINIFIAWLALPAKIFLKIIQMVIVPLIIASIIGGLASTEDSNQMKGLGIKFGLYVLVTSFLSACLGILLTSLFKPGQFLSLNLESQTTQSNGLAISFSGFTPEVFLKLIPINPLSSIVQGQMLDVVIISIIGGIALLSVKKEQGKTVLELLEVVQKICMAIITWAMKLAPYAVFGMMAQVSATTGMKALSGMGLYVLVSFLGFFIFIIFYSLLILVIKKISPITYLKKIATPLLLAFSTSSSAATMPMTLKIAEEELHVPSSTANFLIPLGTTINMAGSAIWHTTAVIFLGQVYQIDLGLAQIAFVVATSIGSAIGSPGVPGVGIGVLAMVLGNIGIPIEGISLIMGVDRLIDMGCTVVNVAGDLTATLLLSPSQQVNTGATK